MVYFHLTISVFVQILPKFHCFLLTFTVFVLILLDFIILFFQNFFSCVNSLKSNYFLFQFFFVFYNVHRHKKKFLILHH